MTDVNPHDDLDNSNSISVVMPTLSSPVPVQSVIHSHQPSVIQTAGPNVQTIQVVRVSMLKIFRLSIIIYIYSTPNKF